jgi:hypothetical protein
MNPVMVTGLKQEDTVMATRKQFLLIDIRGRVYVSDRPQEYVGIVAVNTIIDLRSGQECDGAGETFPIEVAPPSKPPLTWD